MKNILINCMLFLGIAFSGEVLVGDDFEWTGLAGTSSWSTPDNWINLTTGGVDGFPGESDSVCFSSNAIATNGEAQFLKVSESAQFVPGLNGEIALGNIFDDGTIAVDGLITFPTDNSNSSSSNIDTRFQIDRDTTINGIGTIVLDGLETGFQGSAVLTNQATVTGNGSFSLQLLINEGTLNPSNGAINIFSGTSVDNSIGNILIDNSGLLDLTSTGEVQGGPINGIGNASIGGGTLNGVSLNGSLGQALNRQTSLLGTIFNNGTFMFPLDNTNGNSSNVDTAFLIPTGQQVTLDGDGEVVLNGFETGFQGDGELINQSTIRGAGTIDVATVMNLDLIRAENGVFFVTNSTVINADGDIQIAGSGTLDLTTTGEIQTGPINGTGNASIGGGTLNGVSLNGSLNQALNRQTALLGTIVNNGTYTFPLDNTNSSSSNVDTAFLIPAGEQVTLTGAGEVILNGFETGFQGNGELINLSTIRGAGTISADTVTNLELIRSENGVLFVSNSIVTNANGEIQIAGDGTLDLTTTGEIRSGPIDGTGAASIGGGILNGVSLNGSLNQTLNRQTALLGTVVNNGTYTFPLDNTNSNSSNVDTAFLIPTGEQVTLDGNGEVILNGFETGFQGNGELINQSAIRGAGTIAAETVTNLDLIRSENGVLFVSNSTIMNANGDIQIAGDGTLDLTINGEIRSGPVTGTGGASIGGGTLNGVSLNGSLNQALNRQTALLGTIINSGTYTFPLDSTNSNSSNVDTAFLIPTGEQVTLDGVGTVVLNGFETGFQGEGELINQSTIRGAGTIAGTTVTNEEMIQVEDGVFFVSNSTVMNANGDIQIADDGTLDLTTSGEIQSGPLNGSGNASIGGGTLNGVSLVGGLNQALNRQTTVIGNVLINGTYTFAEDNVNSNSSNIDTAWLIPMGEQLMLAGEGEVVLNGIETGFQGDGQLFLIGATIRGSGAIQMPLTNAGTIAAQNSDLNLLGDAALTPVGTLGVDLNGLGFSQSGRLNFSFPIDLNGSLKLTVGDNFDANLGDSYQIITSPVITSTFGDNVDQTMIQSLENGFVFDVIYNPDNVTVVVDDIFLLADINLDGQVNLLDVSPFVDLIISGNFQREGDLNGDGEVSLLDVARFVQLLSGG